MYILTQINELHAILRSFCDPQLKILLPYTLAVDTYYQVTMEEGFDYNPEQD